MSFPSRCGRASSRPPHSVAQWIQRLRALLQDECLINAALG